MWPTCSGPAALRKRREKRLVVVSVIKKNVVRGIRRIFSNVNMLSTMLCVPILPQLSRSCSAPVQLNGAISSVFVPTPLVVTLCVLALVAVI